jgi:hypothetical protein
MLASELYPFAVFAGDDPDPEAVVLDFDHRMEARAVNAQRAPSALGMQRQLPPAAEIALALALAALCHKQTLPV